MAPPDLPTSTPESVPVVGIGSSAGGLDAIRAFLTQVPGDTGLAFVIVQHLKADQETHLPQILANLTSMPVRLIEQGTRVEANVVYIVPPAVDAVLSGDFLNLNPRGESAVHHLSIDFFFASLSQSRRSRAIGVVLSGSGSDGTLGLKAIKSEGGITVVQDPKTARFDGMPRSAIASGIADLILAPEAIATEITRLAKHPYTRAALQPHMAGAPEDPIEIAPHGSEDSLIQKILEILLAHTKIDFSLYKLSTIRRRIERQMMLRKIETVEKYAEHLQKDADEVKALYEDIFIHVTDFFRDPEAFAALRQRVFPEIVKNHGPDQPIRIWVPGCATGEEVYSLGIELTEFLEEQKLRIPLNIFAGDISEPALLKARKGVYADYQMGRISPARLKRFFEKVKGGYKVTKALRDVCIFSRHDVTNNPPIPRVDLISCRNVLIYFSAELQKRVFPVFHYALNPHGFLWLGRAENPDSSSKLFYTVDKSQKIFTKVQGALPPQPRFSATSYSSALPDVPARSEFLARVAESVRSADQVMLFRYSPPSVVTDSNFDVLQFRGRTSPFIEPASGIASYNLLKMVHPDLLAHLRACLQTAKQQGTQTRKERVSFDVDGRVRKASIDVSILNPVVAPKDRQYLVVFEDVSTGRAPKPSAVPAPKPSKGKKGDPQRLETLSQYNTQLQQELEALREYQQSLVEEYEAAQEELTSANEELRSTNEELQSTNEELHSTNEELGTAKEELQAANEELSSTNDELQRRNSELEIALRDLEQSEQRFRMMVEAVRDYAIFMLDPDGYVSTWNEGAKRINGYEASEIIGQHFSKFYTQEDLDRAHPKAELKAALAAGRYEEEGWRVRKDGSRFWANVVITALKDDLGHPRGFAKVTRDLTERRNAERARAEEQKKRERLEQVKRSEESLSTIFERSPSFMTLTVGPDHVFERANSRYYDVLSLGPSIIGRKVREVFPEFVAQGFLEHLDRAYQTGEPFRAHEAPLRLNVAGGGQRLLYVDFVYQPVRNAEGKVYGMVHTGYEVTDRVLARQAVENERENFRNLFEQTPEMVCILKGPEHVFEFVNEAHVRVLGFNATGKSVRVAQPESVEVHGILDDVYRTGKTAELHEIPVTVTNRLRYFNLTYSARRDEQGKINGIMILGIEVTQEVLNRREIEQTSQKLAESRLVVEEERERFNRVAAATSLGVWYCDLPFADLVWNDKVKEHFWLPPSAQVTIEIFYARLHPEDRERTRQAIERSIAEHSPYDIKYRTTDPQNSARIKWVRAIGWTDYDDRGEPIRFDGITLDITESEEAEARFRLLANSIPQIAWTTDSQGRLTYLNDRWLEYTGVDFATAAQDGGQSLLYPEDAERVARAWEQAVRDKSAFGLEARLRSKSGQYRWFLIRGNPVKDRDDIVTRWFGTNTNIDDQKRSLEILATVNSVGQTISAELVLDRLVQSITDAATRLTGAEFGAFFYNVLNGKGESYTLYTISGVPREAFSKFPMPRNTQVFAPTFHGEGIVRSDDITQDPRYGKNAPFYGMPKGHLPVRSYLAAPVISRSGQVIGGLFFGHSSPGIFSEREEEIIRGLASQAAIAIDNAQLYQQAQDAVRSRDMFLSIASHELRTPLTGMKIQTQMFNRVMTKNPADALEPEKVRKLVGTFDGGLNRLIRLVDDMLDISRIQNGRLSLNREDTNVTELVKESLERFRPELVNAGIELKVHGPAAIHISVDRFRLDQVLTNLATNAIRYAPRAPLDVSIAQIGDRVVIRFKDYGPGISQDNREKVFQRFERLVSANQVSGMGLGLYISREIIEAHGGTIRIDSEDHQGACFVIEIPLPEGRSA